MRSPRPFPAALVLALVVILPAWSQLPAPRRDVLFAGISVGMTPERVDSLATANNWQTIKSSATVRTYRKESPKLSSRYTVRFRQGVVQSVSAEQVATREAAKESAGISRMMKQALTARAERIEGKGNKAVYIHTASTGETVRVRWKEPNARTLRVEVTVTP